MATVTRQRPSAGDRSGTPDPQRDGQLLPSEDMARRTPEAIDRRRFLRFMLGMTAATGVALVVDRNRTTSVKAGNASTAGAEASGNVAVPAREVQSGEEVGVNKIIADIESNEHRTIVAGQVNVKNGPLNFRTSPNIVQTDGDNGIGNIAWTLGVEDSIAFDRPHVISTMDDGDFMAVWRVGDGGKRQWFFVSLGPQTRDQLGVEVLGLDNRPIPAPGFPTIEATDDQLRGIEVDGEEPGPTGRILDIG